MTKSRLAAAVMAIATTLAACTSGGGTPSASTPAAATAAAAPWVVGGIVDDTGPGATTGASSKAAFEYWVKKFNDAGGAGGRKLQIEYCDSMSTPAGGATCGAKVAGVNSHLVVLLSALPAAQGAQTRLADVLTLSIIPVQLPAKGTKAFQVAPLFGQVVLPMIAMAKANNITKLGVIYTSDSSGTAQLAALKGATAAASLQLIESPMEPTATDVTPQLVQLRSQGAELIFAATLGSPTNVVLTSSNTLGLALPLVVGAGNVTNAFLSSLSGGIPKNLYGIATLAKGPAFPEAVTKEWTPFQADFQKATGKSVDSVGSSFAYLSCLMKAVMDETKASSADAMAQYLNTKTTTCLGSPIVFANPALNVASGVPAQVVKASSDVGGSWVPAGEKF